MKAILYIGRLTEFDYISQKNLKRLVEAVSRLKDKNWLFFVGCSDDRLYDQYRQYAEELGVDLTIMPPIEREDLPGIYNDADVFVLVSLWEGQSKVLLEAMSCARPCVVSDLECNREVDRGRNALVFCNHLDVGDIAEKIQWVFDHPEEAGEMGKVAREIILEHHDSEKNIQREMELLKEAGL